MKLDADNPMLTAFALGELDEPERAEIEAQLAHDEAARKLVDEIRASAVLVTEELKTERAAGLSEKQQAAIFARHSAPAAAAKKSSFWKPLAAAAMLLFTIGIVGMMTTHRESAPDRRYAMSPPSNIAQATVESAKAGDHFETFNPNGPASGGGGSQSNLNGFQRFTESTTSPQPSNANKATLGYAMEKAPAAYDAKGHDEFIIKNNGTIYKNESTDSVKSSDLDRETGIKVPPAERPAPSVTAPVAVTRPPEAETKNSFTPGANYYIKKKEHDFADYQKLEPAVRPVTGAVSVDLSKSELEKLKREIAELKAKEHAATGDKKETTDRIVDSHYGPVAQPDHNGFKKRPDHEAYNFETNNIVVPNPQPATPGTETYTAIAESGFKRVIDEPLSTFSIDVDTASYANVRRFLNQGQMPPRDAVRIEEMLNYFPYNYGQPQGDDPFAIHVEVAQCPWNTAHRLARVGIKGREFAENKRPAGNYVFLIDVSGSMDEPKKQPLVQAGLSMLVDKLGENDRVGIVTYAGEAAVSLSSTPCSDKRYIKGVINSLHSAGSTNGGDGIQRAYKMATENFIKGGINRVILCTDGDFNVGVTNPADLVKLIEAQAKTGVFLSVLGFGMGDLKDATMQKLADKGNGNYAYIDSLDEVRKVLVDQMTATLATIAKDVKIQVEFNPAIAGAYRLIGYEKRLLNKQDFNNDKIDAGEVGAGHQVTALYEIVPASALESEPGVDPLVYQKNSPKPAVGVSGDLLTLKIRYKQLDGDTSKLIKGAVADNGASYAQASKDFKFAAAVAAFGMLLRESPYRGNTSFDAVLELADEARGKDEGGYRREFLGLVEKAKAMLKR